MPLVKHVIDYGLCCKYFRMHCKKQSIIYFDYTIIIVPS